MMRTRTQEKDRDGQMQELRQRLQGLLDRITHLMVRL
jgi:hypothetical protein